MTRDFEALDDAFVDMWTAWYSVPSAVGAAGLLQWLSAGEGADLLATAVLRLARQRVHLPGLRPFLAQVRSAKESLRTFIRVPRVPPEAASEFLANMQRYLSCVRRAAAQQACVNE